MYIYGFFENTWWNLMISFYWLILKDFILNACIFEARSFEVWLFEMF